MTQTTDYDAIIVGAGPAGFFSAIHAASPGNSVLLLEKNREPGRKLGIAGSGQCNITHEGPISGFLSHYGDHGQFLKPSLMQFPNSGLISFFEDRGLDMVTREDGKVFPSTLSSHDVIETLLRECRDRGVKLVCMQPVREIKRSPHHFTVITPDHIFLGKSLVIAAGGASYPGTGSDGDGYRLAASLSHTIREIAPALVPVTIRDFPFKGLAGLSFPSLSFSLWRNGKKVGVHRGDVLVTHGGLSGPGILDYSRNIRPGDEIRLSFTNHPAEDITERELIGIFSANPSMRVITALGKYPLPQRLLRCIVETASIPAWQTCAHIDKPCRRMLARNLTGFPLVVESLGTFNEAMVTRGGVSLDEVDGKTMESRLVPGLYFAGEVLDIDGDTGGYNIQAACSTGYAAGTSIRTRL